MGVWSLFSVLLVNEEHGFERILVLVKNIVVYLLV